MRWRSLVITWTELAEQLFLAPGQCCHLQLQAIHQPLLLNQNIIQRLDSVILESESALQVSDTHFKRHDSLPHELEIIRQH